MMIKLIRIIDKNKNVDNLHISLILRNTSSLFFYFISFLNLVTDLSMIKKIQIQIVTLP